MKKRTLIRLGALAFALTLAACDSSSSSSSNNRGEGYEPLQGTWRSDCLDYDDTPQRITLDISGDEAISTFDIYQDPDCTQKLGTFTITYRYSVGEDLLTVGGMEAKQLDVVVIDDPDKVAEYPREYDIFMIEGDILYRSQFSSDTADNRPTKLDTSAPFRRQ